MTHYFCVDTETGGLSSSNSLLTLYGLVIDESFNVVNQVDLCLKPNSGQYVIEAPALGINNINLVEHDKRAIDYKKGKETLYKLLYLYKPLHLIGHNVAFDVKFMKRHLFEGRRTELDTLFSRHIHDTKNNATFLKTCGRIPKDVGVSLVQQLKFFFPDLDLEGHHNAEWDAKMTFKLFMAQRSMIMHNSR
jgi:DNA polymerase III alpha subunit (gram-positive type)